MIVIEQVNNYGLRGIRVFGGYDPCFSTYAEEYFNRKDVQSSLHAGVGRSNSNVTWKVCK
jgi:serine carboxypeptidase-like clade 2